MKTPIPTLALVAAAGALAPLAGHAAIVSVVETNLGGDAAAIIEPGGAGAAGTLFGEDTLTFSDRTHQHNGAAFDAASSLLSTGGSLVVPLPSYLVGNEYVRFANNARDNADYSALVTTDILSTFWVLIDNRANGPESAGTSPNNSDPVLGGSLQWVLDGGWIRENTGISPNGQPDYAGVDEGGDGVGAGQGLNQFYSIYRYPELATEVSVGNIGFGGNMISVVVAPIPEPSAGALVLGALAVPLLRRRRR